jgi:hypothetical protein
MAACSGCVKRTRIPINVGLRYAQPNLRAIAENTGVYNGVRKIKRRANDPDSESGTP